jgi:ABC-type nitrate/sulfonate/bicarbonate transport system permease component
VRLLRGGVRLLALPALLIGLWWVYAATANNIYYPTPGTVATTFRDVWLSNLLVDDALPSVLRLLVGVAAAIVLGVALGVPIGSSARLRATVEPVLEFFRAIPPPVLVPVLILVAGIGNGMKVLVIVSGCIWPILLNTVEGVRAVDGVLAETCRCFGITGGARLRHLILRGASPQIMTGIRQALSIGIILMVISEMFASSSGLGFTIVQFQRSFAIPEMWSGIVLLGLLGFGLAMAFRLCERRLLRWYEGLRSSRREGAA